MSVKLAHIFTLVILAVIAVIVGVVWTASTGRSGQRVYLWSALISMGVCLFVWYILLLQNSNDIMDIVYVFMIPSFIILALGFFITGMIHPGTGHSTDSLPYLISAVVSLAIIILVFISIA